MNEKPKHEQRIVITIYLAALNSWPWTSCVGMQLAMNELCKYKVGHEWALYSTYSHERALYLYRRPWTSPVFILWTLVNVNW